MEKLNLYIMKLNTLYKKKCHSFLKQTEKTKI